MFSSVDETIVRTFSVGVSMAVKRLLAIQEEKKAVKTSN